MYRVQVRRGRGRREAPGDFGWDALPGPGNVSDTIVRFRLKLFLHPGSQVQSRVVLFCFCFFFSLPSTHKLWSDRKRSTHDQINVATKGGVGSKNDRRAGTRFFEPGGYKIEPFLIKQ